MELVFREMPRSFIETLPGIQEQAASERESARELLRKIGVRLPPSASDVLKGKVRTWECILESEVVGRCTGDSNTGEILILVVDEPYKGQGIGRTLLGLVVDWLRNSGAPRLWLVSNPCESAYGFYRAMGWRPNGETMEGGDEILIPPPR